MNTVEKSLDTFGPLAARVALALIFVMSGFAKLADPAATAGYIASKGLPLASLLAVLAATLELAAGLALVLGAKTRWAALALAAFLVPVTLIFHNPAGLEGMAAQMQMIQLLKNLSILGGLLAVASFGPGRISVDARLASRRPSRAHA
jgi:putative oxidoreductase